MHKKYKIVPPFFVFQRKIINRISEQLEEEGPKLCGVYNTIQYNTCRKCRSIYLSVGRHSVLFFVVCWMAEVVVVLRREHRKSISLTIIVLGHIDKK